MTADVDAYHSMPRQYPIAMEGYPFIALACAAAIIFGVIGWAVVSFLSLAFALFAAYFFRNPERIAPEGAGLVVAPADGLVIKVDRDARSDAIEGPLTRICVFMSVFDVHINRFPVSGTVRRIDYRKGKFLVAKRDDAPRHNERNSILIEDEAGRSIEMVQIAGLVARRIVCYLRVGHRGALGERLGLIRFGSRVDIYLPSGIDVAVKEGDKVKSGETILARFAKEEARR